MTGVSRSAITSDTAKTYSLRRRMLLTLVPVLLASLMLLAYALERSYAESSLVSLRAQMNLQLHLLLADTEIVNAQPVVPLQTRVPRLNQPESDLYAYAMAADAAVLWRSLSLQGLAGPSAAAAEKFRMQDEVFELINELAGESTLQALGEFYFSERAGLYVAMVSVAFGLEAIDAAEESGTVELISPAQVETMSSKLSFVVIDRGDALALQQQAFRHTLWRWLGLALVALTTVQLLMLFWSFKPLGQLVEEVGRVERGEQLLFNNDYPAEIEPLTDNLNRFVERERKQSERYKHTLGDLAHSLKTPLAAMRSSIEINSNNQTLLDNIDRMDQIVAYQLQRSRIYNAHTLHNHRTDLSQTIGKLLPALNKVYLGRNINVENLLAEPLEAAVANDDAMELLGNILDNAYKYSQRRVRISGSTITRDDGPPYCELLIEDDGPGIQGQWVALALKRGVRLDERQPGQGIGLAVAMDITEAYAGRLEILHSDLGGAKVLLVLPA